MSAESDRLTTLIANIDAYITARLVAGEDYVKFRIGEQDVERYSIKELWEIRDKASAQLEELLLSDTHYVDHYNNGVTWTGEDDTEYVGDDD